MRKLIHWFAWTVVLFGCQPVEEPVSDRERALDRLNHRDYEPAIVILKKMIVDEPDDHEIRVLLATAYVGSSGFNVVDAFKVFQPVFFGGKGDERSELNLVTTDASDDSEAKAVGQLTTDAVSFLEEVTQSFQLVADIPHTSVGERGRLLEALALLSSVPADTPHTVKALAYAGVVNALQFFNMLRDTAALQVEGRPATFTQVVCGLNARAFLEDLEMTTGYLLSSLQAFNSAYPSGPIRAPLQRMRQTAERVKSFYNSTPELLDQAEVALSGRKDVYCPAD